MISSTTWSLAEMCKTHLNAERQEIDTEDTAGYFDGSVSSPDRLLNFVKHCELDAHYHMAIASRVQILPLTKQLTNLAGNAWYVLFPTLHWGLDLGRAPSSQTIDFRPGVREKRKDYLSHPFGDAHLPPAPRRHDPLSIFAAQLNSIPSQCV